MVNLSQGVNTFLAFHEQFFSSKYIYIYIYIWLNIESHGSAFNYGLRVSGLEDSNHEEEVPMATPNSKTLSCIGLGKHKAKLKQSATVSH